MHSRYCDGRGAVTSSKALAHSIETMTGNFEKGLALDRSPKEEAVRHVGTDVVQVAGQSLMTREMRRTRALYADPVKGEFVIVVALQTKLTMSNDDMDRGDVVCRCPSHWAEDARWAMAASCCVVHVGRIGKDASSF